MEITYFLFIFKFMRKQRAPLRDFFSEYNHTKTRSTILSLMLAFLLSVSAVMITQDVDTRGLMASVSQIAGEKQYEADVVLESQADDTLSVVFGSLAQSVDSLSFTLLADPEKFTSLTTDNASAKIDNREP